MSIKRNINKAYSKIHESCKGISRSKKELPGRRPSKNVRKILLLNVRMN